MSNKMQNQRVTFGLMIVLLLFWTTIRFGVAPVEAAREPNVRITKHNLSSSGTGSVKADETQAAGVDSTQVCAFCHTPHAAELKDAEGTTLTRTPLWNRKVPAGSGYTSPYKESSLDAQYITDGFNSQPGGSSKLCLSCHDGSMALGTVSVLGGKTDVSIKVNGSTTTKMPDASFSGNSSTGFTRFIGTDLSNDHPISVSFNSALASADGDMRAIDSSQRVPGTNLGTKYNYAVGIRGSKVTTGSTTVVTKPLLPLEKTGGASNTVGQVQCATCHDPHITDPTAGHNIKFLRTNRFQIGTPTTGDFDAANDIICLACHNKEGWTYSAHANPLVADESYNETDANLREFPTTLKVYQIACLNCHDTHTVPGAKKLLREGTDSTTVPKSGGKAAQEETCYQCHSSTSIVSGGDNGPPNVKTDFETAANYKMPIKTLGVADKHDVGGKFDDFAKTKDGAAVNANCKVAADGASGGGCGKDLIESSTNLGTNRHVECTDCHNPHRVIRAQNGLPGGLTSANTKDAHPRTKSGGGTHKHSDTDTSLIHSNVISGVLRGSWGVEPFYNSESFHKLPQYFDIKRGDPGSNSASTADKSYVTREYQICLKCHSDYAYGTTPPATSVTTGGVANGLTKYTNQAKEFQAPTAHRGEPKNAGTAAGSADTNFNTNNHRSWHPVMNSTGRDLTSRGITSGNPWRAPWNNTGAVGSQTMYCTDCHGSATGAQTVIPTDSNPWGPHGSSNPFILKGTWNNLTGNEGTVVTATTGLCFKCHNYNIYARGYSSSSGTDCKDGTKPGRTGFKNSSMGDLHCYHNKILTSKNSNNDKPLQCTWCHVAVPHGWKNKAFLVNLNDVSEEVGLATGTSKEIAISGSSAYYTKEPYYLKAKLKVYSFAASGAWSVSNCGSRNKSGTGTSGLITNADATYGTGTGASGSQSGDATSNGDKKWMVSTCSNPT